MFDWLAGIIEQTGYFGIAFLMLAENVFPPIPSELIMPLGGYLINQGELNPVMVVISGSIGSLAGTSLWYLAARQLDRERFYELVDKYGRLFTVDRKGMEKAEDRFRRHQGFAVLAGRMLPAIRTLISVPAGFARMSPWWFLALSMVGTLIWITALTAVGYALGSQYEKVSGWINPVTNVLFAAIIFLYVVRLFQGKGRQKEAN